MAARQTDHTRLAQFHGEVNCGGEEGEGRTKGDEEKEEGKSKGQGPLPFICAVT